MFFMTKDASHTLNILEPRDGTEEKQTWIVLCTRTVTKAAVQGRQKSSSFVEMREDAEAAWLGWSGGIANSCTVVPFAGPLDHVQRVSVT